MVWTDIFEPGFLTFEALEVMLRECCAAVFVVSPDDEIAEQRLKLWSSRMLATVENISRTGLVGLADLPETAGNPAAA